MKKFICAAALVLSVVALCCAVAACGFTGSVNTGCKQTSDVVCFARAAAIAPFVREEKPDGEDYEADEENDRETCCGRERGHGPGEPDGRGHEKHERGHEKHEHEREMHERGREGGEDERPHPEPRGGEIYFHIFGHIPLPPAPPAPEDEEESERPEVLPVLPDGELG
ncbi:MAG TPA: hypothetical protein H9693_04080 [Firmicutes bacterium]|nr:hypothetical protein [Bacillota bacterium]